MVRVLGLRLASGWWVLKIITKNVFLHKEGRKKGLSVTQTNPSSFENTSVLEIPPQNKLLLIKALTP